MDSSASNEKVLLKRLIKRDDIAALLPAADIE